MMKDKRLTAAMLTACMLLSLLPGAAFAAEEETTPLEQLKTAIAEGGEYTLEDDLEVTEPLEINRDFTLNLGNYKIINKVEGDRAFHVDTEKFTVNADANGGMTIPEDNTGAYGFIKVFHVGSFVLNGGTYSGNTDGGAFFMFAEEEASGTEIEVNEVNAATNGEIFYTAETAEDLSVTIRGGRYETDTRAFYFDVYDTGETSPILLENVTAVVKRGPCIELAGGNTTFVNNDFTVTGDFSGGYTWSRAAIGLGFEAVAVVKSGRYSARTGNMGANEGFGAYIYTSGGTLTIEDGTFEGSTASLRADVSKGSYPTASSVIHVNGGTYVGDVICGTNTGAEEINISNGTFSSDVKEYLVPGMKQDVGGKVVEDAGGPSFGDVAEVDGQYYTTLQAAMEAARDGGRITLLVPVELTENILIDKDLTITGDQILTLYKDQSENNEGGRISIADGKTVTFDGVELTGSYGADIVAPFVKVNGTAQLVIQNSKITDTSNGFSSSYGLINTMGAAEGSKVTIKDSEISSQKGTNTGATYYVLGGGGTCEFDITGNTVTLGSWFMFNVGASGVISENTFHGQSGQSGRMVNGIALKGLTLSDNTFADSLSGTRFVIGGDYTISGNTFEALADDLAIGIYNKPDTTATISGNTFHMDEGSYGIRILNDWGGQAGDLADLHMTENNFTGTGVYQIRNDSWTGTLDLSTNDFGEQLTIWMKNAEGEITITLPSPTRSGYTFRGWLADGQTYAGGSACTITGDTTFTATAQWQRNSSGGGGGGSVTPPQEEIKDPDVPLTQPLPFTDVAETDWFGDAVRFAYDRGMMNGADAARFEPETAATRGMIVTILHRLEETPEAEASSFTDMAGESWYTAAVNWGNASGVIKGYGDGSFRPNDTITREELAAILSRYAAFKGYDKTALGDLSLFHDGEQVSSWAREDMAWAVGVGLLKGRENGQLDPKGAASRAETAQILKNFCERFESKEEEK